MNDGERESTMIINILWTLFNQEGTRRTNEFQLIKINIHNIFVKKQKFIRNVTQMTTYIINISWTLSNEHQLMKINVHNSE